MIDTSKLEKPYEQYTIRSKVWYVCDYCGEEFQRDKKSRERLNKNIAKDGCGKKECKAAKQRDVCMALHGETTIFKTQEFAEKQKATTKAKFGTEVYFDSEDFKQKRQKALQEKYGVDNPLQNEDIKQKQRQTTLERYGVENYAQTEEFQQKLREHSLAVYGTEYMMQSEEIKAKCRETCLERYGVENYTQLPQYWEDRRKKCLEEHGVEHESQLPQNREKARATTQERYGVEYYSQSEAWKEQLPEFIEKSRETSMERYDADHYSRSEDWADKADQRAEKAKQTSVERYGVEFYQQSEEYRERVPELVEKAQQTCREKFGTQYYQQSELFRERLPERLERTKQTSLERYGAEHYSQTEERKQRITSTMQTRYGVPNGLCLAEKPYGKTEQEMASWLNSMGCNFKLHDYSVLQDRELDLVDLDLHLAIEYCGIYWHNQLSRTPRDRTYHLEKYQRCLDLGFRLITLFDDEWRRKEAQCKGILKVLTKHPDTVIAARKCEVTEISKDEGIAFCRVNHLLGATRLGLYFVGLVHGSSLVGCMSLGRHPRLSNTLVLDRLCFQIGTVVVGGVGKLLKPCIEFAKAHGCTSLLTWSDNRWSQGNSYAKAGFQLEAELPPDYAYVDMNNASRRLSKQSQKKSNTDCPPEMTEHQWALEHGLGRIWDCGKKRWILPL